VHPGNAWPSVNQSLQCVPDDVPDAEPPRKPRFSLVPECTAGGGIGRIRPKALPARATTYNRIAFPGDGREGKSPAAASQWPWRLGVFYERRCSVPHCDCTRGLCR